MARLGIAHGELLEVERAELKAHVGLIEQYGIPHRIPERPGELPAEIRHYLHQAAGAHRRRGRGLNMDSCRMSAATKLGSSRFSVASANSASWWTTG